MAEGEQVRDLTAENARVREELAHARAEQMALAARLRQVEAQWRLVIDHVRDTVWLLDMDLRCVWASPSVEHNRGYTAAELATMTLEEHLTPDSVQAVREIVTKALTPEVLADPAAEVVVHHEFEYRRRDGSTYWDETLATLVRDEQGRPTGFLCVGRNVSERRAEAERLAESERRYRLLADNSTDAVWTADLNGRFTYFSPAARILTGHEPEELVGQPITTALASCSVPDPLAMLAAELRKPRSERQAAYLVESQVQAKDGSLQDIEALASFVYDEQGEPVGLQGATRVVTARKRAEAALRSSEESYRGLFNSVEEAIYIQDFDGTFLDVNDGAVRMGGYAREELLGQTPLVLAAPGRNDPVTLARALAAATAGTPQRFEWWSQPKRGPVTLQDISISRGTWRGRAVLIATARDVAEQRRLAKELEEQRMLLDAMIRNVPLDVWACDTEGLVILQSARSIERRGDRHGRALVSRSGDRTLRAEWRDQLARALAGEVVVTDVERVVEGETRHLHEVVAPARVAGEVRGVMGVSVDLTEFRRLQHMALDTRRFESLVRMAGGVAHDFNNLLTVILGYAELILAELAPSSPLRDPLEQIRTAGERAARLAHQMLIYSGRAPVRTRPIDVSKVIAEMSHLHEGAVGPRARLLLELAPDLPRIDADESQIRQVVENLVTNAAEAIGDAAGTITITTEVKEVEQAWLDQRLSHRQATAGRFVCVSVTDTGCGIAEDALPQLFDPFYSTKFTGRGLGLPVVRGIAVAQRGVVWATSLPGQGARFEVLFPVLTETAAPPESPAPAVAWRGAGTILVVDDEPGVRDLACRLVADLGFATLSAANGAEALDLFGQRGHEIVGVLLDYAMPGLDGAAVCRELRAAGCRAPILLSSGYSENGLDDALDGLDLAGFLHKPYTPGQVGAALHQALAG